MDHEPLEVGFGVEPETLDWVELRGIDGIEDKRDVVSSTKVSGFLASVDIEVVKKEDTWLVFGVLDQLVKELEEVGGMKGLLDVMLSHYIALGIDSGTCGNATEVELLDVFV